MDIPCLATSHTNNRVYVNRAHDESLKNNDNRVIWWVLDTEGRPLFQCTIAQYCHKNTRQRKYHEPCGCWEWYANLRKKINKNALSSWVRKPRGLGTSGCSWCDYACLKKAVSLQKSINCRTQWIWHRCCKGRIHPHLLMSSITSAIFHEVRLCIWQCYIDISIERVVPSLHSVSTYNKSLQRGGKGTNQDAKKLGVHTRNPLQVMT